VCRVLELADVRAYRWRQRLRETGSLEDRDPGGGAVHGILAWEEQAILDLIERWGWVDRSHPKLAHRGSYTATVFISPSTLLRVALKHRVVLPGEPFRPRPVLPAMPQVRWEKNRILDMGRMPAPIIAVRSPTGCHETRPLPTQTEEEPAILQSYEPQGL
jgi:hypothetical protein